MLRLKSIIILLFAGVMLCSAQKTKNVSAEYTFRAPETMSISQAREIAIERAKIQAIADEFGTVVSNTTGTMVHNVNGKSTIDFMSLGGSEVRGEWIEDKNIEVSAPIFEQNMIVITAKVSGKAREIVSAHYDLRINPLRNGTEDRFSSTEFYNDDDLYLSFKTPISGYLAVYLVDAKQQVYCLLPYSNQTTGIYKVKANQPYVFFSIQNAPASERAMVDEYILNCSGEAEHNLLYVIFSPNPFVKALDNSVAGKPRNLTYTEFQKWIANCLKEDTKMYRSIIPITIHSR